SAALSADSTAAARLQRRAVVSAIASAAACRWQALPAYNAGRLRLRLRLATARRALSAARAAAGFSGSLLILRRAAVPDPLTVPLTVPIRHGTGSLPPIDCTLHCDLDFRAI